MAESDSTLEILINTVLNATGYRMNEAEAAKLQATIVQTSNVSVAANVEDAATTDKLGLKKRELMHIVNALGGQAVPELARSLSSLAYAGGPVAAIFLVVGVFEMVRNKIKEAQKASEEFDASAATGAFRESAEAAATAMQDAVNSQEAYLRNLEQIKLGQHGITVELNNQLQLMAAIQAARQNEADAHHTLDLAKLKEDEVFGRVSESQAIIKRGEIEKKFIEDKAAAERQAFKDQQDERKRVLEEANRKEADLEKARDEAKKKLDSANADVAHSKNAPTIDDVKKAQSDAEAANLDEKKRRLNDPLYAEVQKGDKQRAVDAAQSVVDRAAQIAAEFRQAERARRINVKALEDDLAAKEKAVNENGAAASKTRGEIDNANRTQRNPFVEGPERDALKEKEGAIDSGTRTELFKHAKEIEDKMHKSGIGSLSAEDARDLGDYLREISKLPAATAQGIRHALGDYLSKEEFKREMDNLRTVSNRPVMRGSPTGQ